MMEFQSFVDAGMSWGRNLGQSLGNPLGDPDWGSISLLPTLAVGFAMILFWTWPARMNVPGVGWPNVRARALAQLVIT